MSKNNICSISQIKRALRLQRDESADLFQRDDHRTWRLDRHNAAQYFGIHPRWGSTLRTYLTELKAKGERAVHVDVCGRATGEYLGAEISYCFSLKVSDTRLIFARKEDVFFDGDIFSAKDFANFLKVLKRDSSPALVTFNPVAGLCNYNGLAGKEGFPDVYKKMVYFQLEKRLRAMFHIIRPGGYIFLERPFQFDGALEFLLRKPPEEWELSINMKRIAEDLKCRLEIRREVNGLYFMIRKYKRKRGKACISLYMD